MSKNTGNIKNYLAAAALTLAVSTNAWAATSTTTVTVYGEGAYTATDLKVNVYADIVGDPLVSFGIGLEYDTDKLTFDPDPLKTKRNEAVWYMGDGSAGGAVPPNYGYKAPEDVNVAGTTNAVLMIGGKLDTGLHPDDTPKALDGVPEGTRILLGTFSFDRNDSNPVTQDPTTKSGDAYFGGAIGLAQGGSYVNFANINGDDLDTSAVTWAGLEVYQLGDASKDGKLTPLDMGTVRNLIVAGTYIIYADANQDGKLTPVDMGTVRNLIINQ